MSMNGKGSAPRPFSVDFQTFEQNLSNCIKNSRDLYREAVISPDFSEKYPCLSGNWGDDREKWERILTFGGC